MMAQATLDSGLNWVTLFDNMNAKSNGDGKDAKSKKLKTTTASKKTDGGIVESENMEDVYLPGDSGEPGAKGSKKRLSIERIYQKKSQLEHILLRPDTYIGSVEKLTQSMWVYDEDQGIMVQKELTFVPGLYKIFDEILVNAADNKQRDPNMTMIKIDIDPEANKIKIWNNGKGIPVVEHKTENMYVPTMIFGHLLTSSNYDDTEKKVTGGRNGYGAKLCNIFSTKFIVETSSKEFKKTFKQTWIDNMGKTKDPTIGESKHDDFTCITFHPDLSKFKMDCLDKDTVDLFTRRAYDIAASTKGVRVMLNGKKLPIKSFQDYVNLYIKDKVDDNGAPLKVVYENPHPRWEVAVTISEKGFQQVSFVNSIATTKGGRHVDNVTDQVVTKLIDIVKKKNKGGVQIKPFQVKNHMWIFVNCLIENPTFDSQTKENMTLQAKSFGSKCSITEKFITQASKCGIVESILSWMKFKQQAQLNKKCHASKHSKLKGIPKLDDANDAGTRNSKDCTLILTEGDSAKTLAVAGLGIVGRDHYGVFPLRGKVLNVREATHKQLICNAICSSAVYHYFNNLLFSLGTSTSKEAKEYFSDMDRHKIPFKYAGTEDDASINLAFSKKKIEERKEWLTNWMEERKRRAELGLPESYLYGKDTHRITFNDFINKELILFSNMDNTRSIPSLVDGFKPGQRKVMFTCFKRNLHKELKVAQLAGSVAEQSAYHHGEQSLMATIINLAQNFVGSNNLNVLMPGGQFGTRIHGGKDAASPRYIFTQLSPLARLLYNPHDDPLLKSNFDDNQKIEPEWYIPILPMVLKPSYKNFKGTIEELSDNKYVVSGEVSIIDDQTIEITELPIRTWTQVYKEEVLEPMLYGTEKTPASITDYKEYNTDTTVKFVVKMSAEKLAQAEEAGLHKVFKLQSTISTSSMVLFDHNGCIRRYQNVEDMLQEFFDLRLTFYQKRKDYLEGFLQAEADKLDNIARFIMEKIAGTVTIENKPKKELITMLVRRGYDSDPMKKWKELQAKSTKEELEILRKKSKEDLWKADLEEFLQKLDEVEQTERDDELLAINKPVKQKGKLKPRKPIEETKPSPMGRRVEPRVDTAMKNKAKQDAAKKIKDKIKKEQKNLLDMFNKDDDEEEEPKSLAERLNIKKENLENARAPRVKQNSGSPGKKKGGKKHNPWSDSEESGGDISSDNDMDGSFLEDVIPRDRPAPRRAAHLTKGELIHVVNESMCLDAPASKAKPEPKVTMEFSDDEDEIAKQNSFSDPFKSSTSPDASEPISIEDDDMFKPVEPIKKKTAVKAPPKKRAAGEKKAPKEKKPRKPKAAKKDFSSDLSDLDDDDKPKKKQLKATKKRPAKKFDDSDLSGDEFMPKKKKTTTAKKKFVDSDEDEDDFNPEDISDVAPRSRTGRGKAPVKYNFGDDDEDSDF
ncbi:hypothetical protein KUTeg_002079 [Tegillarca granosa]|uniref:DNA topoisomerase 2 n=1 Tax=Tegillarca granosa TaxID=220873 RepID=A0ABQ9FUQ4_TEGGR|nr:hypothetical protein KUTeg_002079 [Tegillarca granosa]